MKKLISFFSLCLLLAGCHNQKYDYEDVRYNYSSYRIKVNYNYFPGVELVLFDSEIPEVSGTYLSAVQLQVGDDLIELSDVVLVDVDEIMERGYPLSRIISHEYIHYKQKLAMASYQAFADSLTKELTHAGYDASKYEQEAYNKSRDYPIIAFIYGKKDSQFVHFNID